MQKKSNVVKLGQSETWVMGGALLSKPKDLYPSVHNSNTILQACWVLLGSDIYEILPSSIKFSLIPIH
jgi:hypothetical protein